MDLKNITLEDIREQRPDLYQEIAKEVTQIPHIVTDEEVEEIIKPLFDEFEEETEKRLLLLENRLHLIVKSRMKDILSTLIERNEIKKQPRKRKKKNNETIQRKALIGDTIIWRPTGEVGKVVRFELEGNLQKIVLKLKSKEYIKVYDNWKMYDVLLDTD